MKVSTEVDQKWGLNYTTDLGAVPENQGPVPAKQGHEFDSVLHQNTIDYRVPKERLKEWQKYLAEEQTCLTLASVLIEHGTFDTIVKMKNILLLHYKHMVRKRFPTNLSKEFG